MNENRANQKDKSQNVSQITVNTSNEEIPGHLLQTSLGSSSVTNENRQIYYHRVVIFSDVHRFELPVKDHIDCAKVKKKGNGSYADFIIDDKQNILGKDSEGLSIWTTEDQTMKEFMAGDCPATKGMEGIKCEKITTTEGLELFLSQLKHDEWFPYFGTGEKSSQKRYPGACFKTKKEDWDVTSPWQIENNGRCHRLLKLQSDSIPYEGDLVKNTNGRDGIDFLHLKVINTEKWEFCCFAYPLNASGYKQKQDKIGETIIRVLAEEKSLDETHNHEDILDIVNELQSATINDIVDLKRDIIDYLIDLLAAHKYIEMINKAYRTMSELAASQTENTKLLQYGYKSKTKVDEKDFPIYGMKFAIKIYKCSGCWPQQLTFRTGEFGICFIIEECPTLPEKIIISCGDTKVDLNSIYNSSPNTSQCSGITNKDNQCKITPTFKDGNLSWCHVHRGRQKTF